MQDEGIVSTATEGNKGSRVLIQDKFGDSDDTVVTSIENSYIKKLYTIEGQPPSIYQKIQGCKFHPRCNLATQNCEINIPELKEYNQNHFCACFEI